MLPLVGMMSEVEMPVSVRAAETLFARPDLTGARRPERSCEGGAFEAFGAIPVGIGCRSMQSAASAKRAQAKVSREPPPSRQTANRRHKRTFGSRDPALATFASPTFRQRVDAGDHLPARTLFALLGVLRALTDPLGSAANSELNSRSGNADTLASSEQMQELGPLRGDFVVVLLDPARFDVEEIFLCDLSWRSREERSQVVLALRFAVCARWNKGQHEGRLQILYDKEPTDVEAERGNRILPRLVRLFLLCRICHFGRRTVRCEGPAYGVVAVLELLHVRVEPAR